MDHVITGIARRKHIVITNLKGFDRSRFLLKVELHLLSSSPNFVNGTKLHNGNAIGHGQNGLEAGGGGVGAVAATAAAVIQEEHCSGQKSFKRIYHVVDNDELIRKIYLETSQLPFGDFNLSVAKLYSNQTGASLLYQSDSRDIQCMAPLTVCHMRFIFDEQAAREMQIDTTDAIIIFDGIALEKIEESCLRRKPSSRRRQQHQHYQHHHHHHHHHHHQQQHSDSDTISLSSSTSSSSHLIDRPRDEQPATKRHRHATDQHHRHSIIYEQQVDSDLAANEGGGNFGLVAAETQHRQQLQQQQQLYRGDKNTSTGTGGGGGGDGSTCKRRGDPDEDLSWSYLPRYGFIKSTQACWSILLACNPPVDGLEHDLGYKFECCTSNVSSYHQQQLPNTATYNNHRIFSSILTTGPNDVDIFYITKYPYNEIARTVRECLQRLTSPTPCKALVVFRDFGRALDYHAKWSQLEMFDKIGFTLFVDTGQCGSARRKVLLDFHNYQGNALLLTSHTFNDNIGLSEYVFSSAKMMIVVALPRPSFISSEVFSERFKYNNKRYFEKYPSTALNGFDLIYNRGLETLNGTIRKYLSEHRWQDCAIFIMGSGMGQMANKLTSELVDIRKEKFSEAMERFEKFCHF